MSEDIEVIREAYESLKRIHITANESIEKLQNDILLLKVENEFLKSLNTNADKNVEIQKMIVINSLQSSQEKHERDYKEISDLKKEISKLKKEILELKSK